MPKNHLLSSISAQEGSAATCETRMSVQKLSLKMSAFFAAICLLAAALFALAPGNLAYAAEYQNPDNADVTYTYTEEDGTAHITGITTTNDVTEAKIPGTIEINGTEGTTFLPVARVTFAQGVSTITSLDLSACSDLTSFYCASSTLEAAKFQGTGKLTSIEFITPAGNLSSLDLVGCSELTKLVVNNNKLTGFDVSGCPNLEELQFNNNKVTELSLIHHEKLTALQCSANELTALDLTNCPELTSVECNANKLTS